MSPRPKDTDSKGKEFVMEQQGGNGASEGADAAVTWSLNRFLDVHRNQLEASAVPNHLWPTLFSKIVGQTFDAGSAFSFACEEDEESGAVTAWKVLVAKEDGVRADDPAAIFLIDHAWTFRPRSARQQLEGIPGLAQRMAALMGIAEDGDDKLLVDCVMREKWRHANTYWVGNAEWAEDRVPVWYVMDEFGSKIQHSDEPNVRAVPFISTVDGAAYSLMFPVKDVECGEEICRDFLEGPEATDPLVRRALLNAWKEEDLAEEVDWRQTEPGAEFFAASRQNESYPDPDFKAAPLPTDRKIRVFAEYIYIGQNLKHPRFEMVDNEEDADVLWLTKHYKTFKELSEQAPHKRINQFPFENVVTIKDLLGIVGRRKAIKADGDDDDVSKPASPSWLPVTYNLKTEIPQFVSYFQRREKLGLDNHWIVKAWNLARGLDMHISPDLHHILRLPFSGPKVAQKYIEDPVLFERPEIGKVKLDIRYIIILTSVEPLKVYVYDRFWLRFANVAFDLSDFDQYEKHFTVMNYGGVSDFKQMFCHDFVAEFERQYPDYKWKEVEADIFSMFRELFEAAAMRPPPCGIAPNAQSRAMYAADLMLAWEKDSKGKRVMRPRILEVNWGADCQRACEYYPEFFDNVFSTMFLDQSEGQNVTLVS